MFALLHETCMHFSLLVFDFVSLPKTELLGQYERQLIRHLHRGLTKNIFTPNFYQQGYQIFNITENGKMSVQNLIQLSIKLWYFCQ